jgi:hypothetical protein
VARLAELSEPESAPIARVDGGDRPERVAAGTLVAPRDLGVVTAA